MVLSQYRLFYQQKYVYMKQMVDIPSLIYLSISKPRDRKIDER